jgi:hypothetical protein
MTWTRKEVVRIRRKSREGGFNFKAASGAEATLYRLDSPKALDVASAFARWRLRELEYEVPQKELKTYHVVKFCLGGCTAYVIALCYWEPEALVYRYQMILRDALYATVLAIVCNGRVHEWSSRTGTLIIEAIAANSNPNVDMLLAEE